MESRSLSAISFVVVHGLRGEHMVQQEKNLKICTQHSGHRRVHGLSESRIRKKRRGLLMPSANDVSFTISGQEVTDT